MRIDVIVIVAVAVTAAVVIFVVPADIGIIKPGWKKRKRFCY
jgi:hypothetical protein